MTCVLVTLYCLIDYMVGEAYDDNIGENRVHRDRDTDHYADFRVDWLIKDCSC